MKKKFYIFILVVLIVILSVGILDIISITNLPKTRYEARCATIGSIKRYKELLQYNIFKKTQNDVVNYKILRDDMLNYNKECKEYSKKEEELINKNYNKAIAETKKK